MLGEKPVKRRSLGQKQEVSLRILAILAVALFLGACAQAMDEGGDSMGGARRVGTVLDPFCGPDGSVVTVQFPTDQGSFDGAMASRENCPWTSRTRRLRLVGAAGIEPATPAV